MSTTKFAYDFKEHPLASANPYTSEQQYTTLKADININGVLVPVVLYRGLLVDGRHRVKSCLELYKEKESDGMVPFVELPHKTSLEEVRAHVNSLETRRHQTKTQLDIGHWMEHVYNNKETLRVAHEKTGVGRSTLSSINKIVDHFGINTINELRKGSTVTLRDSFRVVTTDSINKIAKFIATIDDKGIEAEKARSKHERMVSSFSSDIDLIWLQLNPWQKELWVDKVKRETKGNTNND